jgi:hypothetical protein
MMREVGSGSSFWEASIVMADSSHVSRKFTRQMKLTNNVLVREKCGKEDIHV